MIVYEVNVEVSDSILRAYSTWLKEHVLEILDLPGFEKANIFTDDKKFCIQYWLASKEDLDNYFKNHAPLMRQKGTDLFKDGFSATRRILIPQYELARSGSN